MKKTINFSDFQDSFAKMGRKENFSYEGLKALFNYLESYEEDTGNEIELDVIALCCEYTEYENLEECQKDYNVEDIRELERNTTVIKIDDESFIIQSY